EKDARAALAREQQFDGKCLRLNAQVRAASRLRQERSCSGAAQAAIAGHLRIADTLMLAPVEIAGERDANLLRRLDEPAGGRRRSAVALNQNWAALPPLIGLTRPIALDRLEVGQHLVERPALAAQLRPAIVIGRIAADPQHAIDGTRPAEHATARPVDLPAGN